MISQHIKHRRPINMEAALAYARGFGVPLEAISPRLAALARRALEQARMDSPQGAVESPRVAQPVMHQGPNIDPPKLTWDLILLAPLPENFMVLIRDDAMAMPDQRGMGAGDYAIFEPADRASAGDIVLIADSDENLYMRRYQERTPGHWLAVARNSAYQPLDSKVDGLRVIALLVGTRWGRQT